MKLPRRNFLHLAAGAAALSARPASLGRKPIHRGEFLLSRVCKFDSVARKLSNHRLMLGDGGGDKRIDPGVPCRRPIRGALGIAVLELRQDRTSPRRARRYTSRAES